jgi:hypothetical protein
VPLLVTLGDASDKAVLVPSFVSLAIFAKAFVRPAFIASGWLPVK